MTDYTKLIERADPFMQGMGKAILREIAASFEALQGENGQLHASLQSARTAFEQVCKHRDALAAKLDELQRQEPVATGCRWCKHPAFIVGSSQKCPQCGKVFVKEAPKALEPLTDEQSATLFQAVKDDPRSAKFSVRNWFTCGLVTAEAAHGITKGTP